MIDSQTAEILLELTDIIEALKRAAQLRSHTEEPIRKRLEEVRRRLVDALDKGKHTHKVDRHVWGPGHYVFYCACGEGVESIDGTTWKPIHVHDVARSRIEGCGIPGVVNPIRQWCSCGASRLIQHSYRDSRIVSTLVDWRLDEIVTPQVHHHTATRIENFVNEAGTASREFCECGAVREAVPGCLLGDWIGGRP